MLRYFLCMLLTGFAAGSIAQPLPALIPYHDFSKGWGFCDSTGKVIVSPQYDEPELLPHGFYLLHSWSFNTGLMNAQGKVLVEPKGANVQVLPNEMFLVQRMASGGDYQYGLLDTAGLEILPVIYDYIGMRPGNDRSFVQYESRFKRGIVDARTGKIIAGAEAAGPGGYIGEQNDMMQLFGPDGKPKGIAAELVELIDNRGYYLLTTRRKKKSYCGLMDSTGRIIFPAVYSTIDPLGSDRFYVGKDGETWLTDTSGQLLLPSGYIGTDVFDDRYWCFTRQNDKQKRSGIYDALTRKIIFEPVNEETGIFSAAGQRYLVLVNNGWTKLVDSTGRTVAEHLPYIPCEVTEDGYWIVRKGEKYGLCRPFSTQAIKTEFDGLREIGSHRMAYKQSGKYGLADTSGAITTPDYLSIGTFRQGYAIVNLTALIDSSGKLIMPLQRYQSLERHQKNHLLYYLAKDSANRYMLLTFNGSPILDSTFDAIYWRDDSPVLDVRYNDQAETMLLRGYRVFRYKYFSTRLGPAFFMRKQKDDVVLYDSTGTELIRSSDNVEVMQLPWRENAVLWFDSHSICLFRAGKNVTVIAADCPGNPQVAASTSGRRRKDEYYEGALKKWMNLADSADFAWPDTLFDAVKSERGGLIVQRKKMYGAIGSCGNFLLPAKCRQVRFSFDGRYAAATYFNDSTLWMDMNGGKNLGRMPVAYATPVDSTHYLVCLDDEPRSYDMPAVLAPDPRYTSPNYFLYEKSPAHIIGEFRAYEMTIVPVAPHLFRTSLGYMNDSGIKYWTEK